MILFNLILIFGVSTVFGNSELETICSSKITSLNTTDRNIQIITPGYSRCDTGISRGWYSFGKNRRLPTTCPKTGACSSDPPIWTKNEQPNKLSPGPVTLSLCQSYSSNGVEHCEIDCSYRIKAAYCSNLEMIVYEFLPVPTCNMRYCYAEYDPCALGENTCDKPFPFHLLPNGTTTLASSVYGPVVKCAIKCPNGIDCSKLNGEVFWYAVSSTGWSYKKDLIYNNQEKELYSMLEPYEWNPFHGYQFYCKIRPSYNGDQYSEYLYTSPYTLGSVPFPFAQLTNGTTTLANVVPNPLYPGALGIIITCSIKCPVNTDCSKLSGEVFWQIKSTTTWLYKKELKYDAQNKEMYSYLEPFEWNPHYGNEFYCKIRPSYNGYQYSEYLYTSLYPFGLPLFPFAQLTNGTTALANVVPSPLYPGALGVIITCSIKCPVNTDCSKLSGDVFWQKTSSTESMYKKELKYDAQDKEMYSYLEPFEWIPHFGDTFYCKIKPSYNSFQSSEFLYTSLFSVGAHLNNNHFENDDYSD